MGIFETILLIVMCGFFAVFFYGLWLLEDDNDEFRKKHGVKPKYYRCVTKGDKYCNHSDWCDTQQVETKLKENDTDKDK